MKTHFKNRKYLSDKLPLIISFDVPPKNLKPNIRAAIKYYFIKMAALNEAMEMALAMDGSGELGGVICSSFDSDIASIVTETEALFNVDMEVVADWLHEAAEKTPQPLHRESLIGEAMEIWQDKKIADDYYARQAEKYKSKTG